MTVILVLALFVSFLVIERFTGKKAPEYVLQTAPRAEAGARKAQPIVAGFEIPEHLRFHQGHAWALGESPNLVRAGIDDFAAKLIGDAEEVNLPQRGQWIRQGQKILSFKRNGVAVDMVSPIEGSVSDINDAVIANPEAASKDPYGEGWLVTVQSPDAKTNFRNLMGGALARWWMEEAVGRLQKRLPASMGSLALAQDGGIASDNLAAEIPDEEYLKITREFFLA